jgi:serine protease AprX
MLMAAPGLTSSAGAAPVAPGPAMNDPITVVITPAQNPAPYNGSDWNNKKAQDDNSHARENATKWLHKELEHWGQIKQDLNQSGGVIASVTPDELVGLQANPDIVVTPNTPVSMADASLLGGATRAPAAVFPQATGATSLSGGVNGAGITVAVLDTGITKLPDFRGRITGGVDLSGEGNPYKDSYGHGTFVAGLIAGDGTSSNGQYQGEAPGANLVAIKVAGASGVTDVSTVIQGINWAIQHKNDQHISVLNLSLGAIPTSSTVTNPLDQAVEAAWQAGITVVASAGNAGPSNGTITSPGDDPLAITAGSIDDLGTADNSDDAGTTFSSVGPTSPDGFFKPDLVTSGRSVVSLRAPGSTIDTLNPTARIGNSNFVGSGTSFSTAITSGAAALVIQSDSKRGNNGFVPSPDKVKAQLVGTATKGPIGNPFVDGHGELNVLSATQQTGLQLTQVAPMVPANFGDTINLQDTWNGSSWNGSTWNGSTWNGSSWNGSSWNGSSWNGSTWNGSTWNGSTWNGSSWNGSSWNGSTWNGSTWNGSSWNGSSWNGSSWNGSTWNGSSWNGSSWNGSSWN